MVCLCDLYTHYKQTLVPSVKQALTENLLSKLVAYIVCVGGSVYSEPPLIRPPSNPATSKSVLLIGVASFQG